MKSSTKSFILSMAILFTFTLFGAACIPNNFFKPPPPPPAPPGLALTLTVQAIQLQSYTQTAQAQQAQPIIIVVTATPDPALATATTDPAANIAPAATTSSAVTVTVSQNTNCRAGPGQAFNDVGSLGPGQIAEVIGKDTFDNYWIIKLPDGSGKTCWLWGQYATVSGDASKLAEVATPTPKGGSAASTGPLNAPTLTGSVNCVDVGGGDYEYQVGLDWKDNSTNETKFNIYTSTSDKFTAPANKTFFDFDVTLPSGTDLFVTIKAANDSGESSPSQIGLKCP